MIPWPRGLLVWLLRHDRRLREAEQERRARTLPPTFEPEPMPVYEHQPAPEPLPLSSRDAQACAIRLELAFDSLRQVERALLRVKDGLRVRPRPKHIQALAARLAPAIMEIAALADELETIASFRPGGR